jgi:hypothetical protein
VGTAASSARQASLPSGEVTEVRKVWLVILRCTKKLLTVIGSRQLIDRTPDGEDWYANLPASAGPVTVL